MSTLEPSESLELYRKLYLARSAEERIRKDYFNDEMKTPVHLGIGAEGIDVGVIHSLKKGTQVFGTYRNHNIFLALSEDTDGFYGELFGKETGCAKGKAGSMHMSCPDQGLVLTSAVVGTTIPVAVGAALAHQYRGEKDWVAVFFGEGAVEEGVFWESLNFASLRKLKILFVCQDNRLAIHTHRNDRWGYKNFGDAVSAFGCQYQAGDGRHAETVVAMTRKALAQGDATPGPVLLHLDYFRFLQHVGPLEDFDAGYRQKPADLEEKQDPVRNFKNTILKNGLKLEEITSVERQIDAKIEASVQKARAAAYASPSELHQDVYYGE